MILNPVVAHPGGVDVLGAEIELQPAGQAQGQPAAGA